MTAPDNRSTINFTKAAGPEPRTDPPPGAAATDRPAPFSLRLSAEERRRLEQAAAGMPLGTFIRDRLLGGDLTPRRTRGRNPVKDHAALARVLGALGASRLSSNLNQIARAAHLGVLPVTPELEEDLSAACADIRAMRTDLMKALGFLGREDVS